LQTTLYLARHGETLWNVEGRLQGHLDSPLTEVGKRQAGWLRRSLESIPFDAIYTSPSGRAYHTAEILRGDRNVDIITCDSLNLIVTHAIAKKVLMAHCRGDSLDRLWSPPIIQPTALSKVIASDQDFKIEQYGDVSHIQ